MRRSICLIVCCAYWHSSGLYLISSVYLCVSSSLKLTSCVLVALPNIPAINNGFN